MAGTGTEDAFERTVGVAARVTTWVTIVYLVAPVLVIVPLSFTGGSLLVYPMPGFSLQWYDDFIRNPLWTRSVWNSLMIASATAFLATVLGTMAAIGLHWSKWAIARSLAGLLIAPVVVPVVVIAVAVFYYFSELGLVGGLAALIIAHTTLAIPFVVVTVLATLKGFDVNLVRAASSLGARPHTTFLRIMLPVISPGVLSGALFAFVTSFDEIVIALFIAGPEHRTLPRQIFAGVSESITPTIAVAAVILALVSLVLMCLVEALRRRAERMRA